MDTKDQMLAVVRALEENTDTDRKLTTAVDRVRIEVREKVVNDDDHHRMYIDDQRRLYTVIGGLANDIAELKAAKPEPPPDQIANRIKAFGALRPLSQLLFIVLVSILLLLGGGAAKSMYDGWGKTPRNGTEHRRDRERESAPAPTPDKESH